jgi:ferritin-like metal-binding protein YciE
MVAQRGGAATPPRLDTMTSAHDAFPSRLPENPMSLDSMQDLLITQLNALHAAERHSAELLPKLADAAANPELARTLRAHASHTTAQLERLDNAFETLGVKPPSSRVESEAMKGLAKDCLKLASMRKAEPHVRDAAIIGVAQHVDHDEIAGYGCARTWARLLGHEEIANDLQASLDEERHSDAELSRLAENINRAALTATAT